MKISPKDQQRILRQVKSKVTEAFKDIQLWSHDIDHVRNVAAYGRQIAIQEANKLAPKMNLNPEEFIFLVEVACWFHDLGRSIETEELLKDKNWDHALRSVEMAGKILNDVIPDRIARVIPAPACSSYAASIAGRKAAIHNNNFIDSHLHGNDKLGLVLQAVAEHNQAFVKHPDNLITRVLQDSDRGEGFGFRGMVIVFNYNNILNTRKLVTETECKEELLRQWPILMQNSTTREKVIYWLGYVAMWYTGSQKISPLFTDTARKIYKPKFEITKKYLEMAKNEETHSKNF